jgi:hypothetical protein
VTKIGYVIENNIITNAIVLEDSAVADDWGAVELLYRAGIGWIFNEQLNKFTHPFGIIEEETTNNLDANVEPEEIPVYNLDDELRSLINNLDN